MLEVFKSTNQQSSSHKRCPCSMNAAIVIFFCVVLNLTCGVAFILSRPFGMSPALLRKSKLLRAAPLHEYQTIFRDRLSHFMETGNVKMPTDGQGDDWALRTNYIDLTALEELFNQQDEADSEQASAPSVTYSSKTTTTSQSEFLIEQRIKKAKESKSDAASSAIAFSSILNEMKDKGIWNTDLIASAMLHIAKLEAPRKVKHAHGTPVSEKLHVKSGQTGRTDKNEQTRATPISSPPIISIQNSIASKQISALKLYIKAAENKDITADTAFLRKYILSLYLHNSPASTPCVELLLPLQLISVDTLLPGEVCASIHAYGLYRTDELEQAMHHKLAAYYAQIDAYSILDAHLVLRTLSRYQLIPSIFTLLRYVRESPVLSSNVETIELLSQSLVRTVSKGQKAESMAELPKSEADYPEVVFVGRSNVGKSSLVNCLLNRKALASTSATPGHTRAFHFFIINQPTPSAATATSVVISATGVSTSNPLGTRANRSNVAPKGQIESNSVAAVNAPVGAPITLKFVDVPGLGFAGNTSENTVTSWRGLLERYLHRRDALRVVCHLVDARHGVTEVDKEMITIAARAAEERQSAQVSPFQYTIVLTKTDKIDPSELNRITEDVKSSVVGSLCSVGGDTGMAESGSFIARAKRAADRKRLLDGVSIIPTSSISRAGAEQVWELIYECVIKKV